MIHFFRQRHPYLTVVLVFVVVLVLGLAQLGSTVNPVPKDLPVLLVQQDAGAKTPAGDVAFGKLITNKLTASASPDGSKMPLEWQTASSEEAAVDAMNRQEAYATLVIPADFSSKLASLLSPNPQSAEVTLYINQGMNYSGATMTNTILTQMLSGTSTQIRAQMLETAGKQGGMLTTAQTAAMAVPIEVATRTVNAVGANSSNGNAPVVLTQLVWFGAMVTTMMLFVAANKATQNGTRLHRIGIRFSQIVMGAAVTGAASLSILWIAGQWFGLDIPDYWSIGVFLFFAGFAFFLLQTTVVSWLGFAGVPLFVLIFFFGAPVLTVPPQLLPQFSHHFLYAWLPLRFSAEGLRDLFYFEGHRNLSGPSWTLAAIGAVGMLLTLLSVVKKHAAAPPQVIAVPEPINASAEREAAPALELAELPQELAELPQDRSDRQSADGEFRSAIRGFLKPPQPAKDNEHFNDNEYRKALLLLRSGSKDEHHKAEINDKAYRETLKKLTGSQKENE